MKALIAVAILLTSVSIQAQSYLVLFRQSEIAISGLGHGAQQDLLQNTNQKNITQLSEWMSGRGNEKQIENLWLIRGATADLTINDAKKLAREPWVQWVLENKTRQFITLPTTSTPSRASINPSEDLWGLNKIGLAKIHADFPQLNGEGVRVGIIDTGIQNRHPELADKSLLFKDFVVGLSHPYDDNGHGTHVSGTIAGKNVGIAPKASLIFAKAFSAVGSATDSQLIAAMQWMFDPDGNSSTNDFPQVVSNSWGGELGSDLIQDIKEFLPYELAIQSWIHGGIIPVFAAGNSGNAPNGFPGGLPDAISVGAIDSQGQVAQFSSRGPNVWKMGETMLTLLKPDLSAPGVHIGSSVPGNQYDFYDGTSMATPHVTGAIALALQANPKLKFAELKALLLKSCDRKIDTEFGFGVLNAYNLVRSAQTKKFLP